MDISFLIYIVLFLVVVILIFKLIKKVIVAIFAVFFLLFLVFAGVGAMMYLDYQDIVGRDMYEIGIIYGDAKNPQFGVSLFVKDNVPDVSKSKALDVSKIDVKKLDDEIYVFIDTEVFKDMLSDNKTYYFYELKEFEVDGEKINASLTKNEVLSIIESKDSLNRYVEIISSERNFETSLKNQLVNNMKSELLKNNLNADFRELLFVYITLSDKDNIDDLVLGFKEEKVNVYPEKFSFKFLRWMPLDWFL